MKRKKRIRAVCILLLLFMLSGCGAVRGGKNETTGGARPENTEGRTETGGEQKETEVSGSTEEDTTEALTQTVPPESCDESQEPAGPFEPSYTETDDTVYALVRLNVRSAESTSSRILGVLSPGEAVRRTGIGDEWMRIVYDGQAAYVSAAYISDIKPTATEPSGGETVPAVTADGTGIFYDNGGILVAIDPGHQAKGNSDQEPVGPGAAETKAKVSSGTAGVSTGIPEHELNLAVSLYLRDELLARGYSVLMIRETADVDISNAERAQLANQYQAAAFVRVHGNSVSDQSVKGALTMCMTVNNSYNSGLYEQSRSLSEKVLAGLCEASGADNRGILETDSMSGINWCEIPVTIVEMGFMSNPEEDQAMASDDYRRALAKGIADGIDAYFGKNAMPMAPGPA